MSEPNLSPEDADLYRRALGETRRTTITTPEGREIVEVRHELPDVGAAIEWLTKHRPDRWKR